MPAPRHIPLFALAIVPLFWALLWSPSTDAQETAAPHDTSSHVVQFVTVDKDVKLEVLDWGGSGRALVLLAGLGSTAHVFDSFATKLTPQYHVYGITRRGFGASSAPIPQNDNYSADRLGDDVLAVLDALKLEAPVLVGHSIGGEELSSIASRYPGKVAGLVYLDPYSFAFYDSSRGDLILDAVEVKKEIDQLILLGPMMQKPWIQQLLQTLPQFEKELNEQLNVLPAEADSTALVTVPTRSSNPAVLALEAILMGQQKYTNIRVPVLAIFAYPNGLEPSRENAMPAREADEFEKGIPNAHVVRLPHATHRVFESNATDVLHEIRSFLEGLN